MILVLSQFYHFLESAPELPEGSRMVDQLTQAIITGNQQY